MCMVASMNTTTSPKPDRTQSMSSLKTAGTFLLLSGLFVYLYIFSAESSFGFVWIIAAVVQLICAGLQLNLVRIQRKSENLSAKADVLAAQSSANN